MPKIRRLPSNPSSSALRQVVRRAQLRLFLNVVLELSTRVAVIVLLALGVVLVFGWRLFPLDWLALIAVSSFVTFGTQFFRRLPDPYRAAIILDRHLNAADTLSTAWHLQQLNGRRPNGAISQLVEQRAEGLARRVRLSRIIPIRVPRYAPVALMLLLADGILFGFRYGRIPQLENLIHLGSYEAHQLMDGQSTDPYQARYEKPPVPEWARRELEQIISEGTSGDSYSEHIEGSTEKFDASTETAEMTWPDGWTPLQARAAKQEEPIEGGQQSSEVGSSAQSDRQEGSPASTREDSPGNQHASADSERAAKGQGEDAQQANNTKESELLRKLQEAMRELLARLNLPDLPRQGRTQQVPQQGRSERGNDQRSTDNRLLGEDDPRANSRTQSVLHGRPGSRESEGTGMRAERRSSTSSSKRASRRGANSGAGRQEGAKALREQEAQEAIGKLVELIGRRSENVKAEAIIEVSSGIQDLKTPYGTPPGVKSSAGSLLHREVIPPLYRDYVKAYFEMLHQLPLEATGDSDTAQQ